ncbi:MAG: hypothetical protein AAF567_14365 [Actinomycetota bacterium]
MTMDRQRSLAIAATAGVAIAALLIWINRRDFQNTPATDRADLAATVAVILGAVVWLMCRRGEGPLQSTIRSAAAGIVIGALAIGLVSVVVDPWA